MKCTDSKLGCFINHHLQSFTPLNLLYIIHALTVCAAPLCAPWLIQDKGAEQGNEVILNHWWTMRGMQNRNLMDIKGNKLHPGTVEESLATEIYFWRAETDHFPIRTARSDFQVYVLSYWWLKAVLIDCCDNKWSHDDTKEASRGVSWSWLRRWNFSLWCWERQQAWPLLPW